MVRDHGEPSVDELRFVAHVALELGLDESQNADVQNILKSGGNFEDNLASINDRDIQLFLFRQVVAAALIDEEINDKEKHYINTTAEKLGITPELRSAFVAWMHEGIEWERRGAALVNQMSNVAG